MNHHDAEMTDVIIVLEDLDDSQTLDVVRELEGFGLSVRNVDNDESTVEGSIVSHKVHGLNKMQRVRCVRSVMSYTVDFPVGDARDLDGPEDIGEDSED